MSRAGLSTSNLIRIGKCRCPAWRLFETTRLHAGACEAVFRGHLVDKNISHRYMYSLTSYIDNHIFDYSHRRFQAIVDVRHFEARPSFMCLPCPEVRLVYSVQARPMDCDRRLFGVAEGCMGRAVNAR